MSTYIDVWVNRQGKQEALWHKDLTPEEGEKVRNYCKDQRLVSILEGALKPVRTDSWENCAKDFFFPTLVNQVKRIEGPVQMVLGIIAAFFLDIITSPIRIIRGIIKILSSAKEERHPLHKYLEEQHAPKQLLDSTHVRVKLGWETQSKYQYTRVVDSAGKKHTIFDTIRHWEEKPVNFIELPEYESPWIKDRHWSL